MSVLKKTNTSKIFMNTMVTLFENIFFVLKQRHFEYLKQRHFEHKMIFVKLKTVLNICKIYYFNDFEELTVL